MFIIKCSNGYFDLRYKMFTTSTKYVEQYGLYKFPFKTCNYPYELCECSYQPCNHILRVEEMTNVLCNILQQILKHDVEYVLYTIKQSLKDAQPINFICHNDKSLQYAQFMVKLIKYSFGTYIINYRIIDIKIIYFINTKWKFWMIIIK